MKGFLLIICMSGGNCTVIEPSYVSEEACKVAATYYANKEGFITGGTAYSIHGFARCVPSPHYK